MLFLIIGLVLWVAAHLFRRLAPGQRAAMTDRLGDKSKGVFAVLILVSLGFIILGYRNAPYVEIYAPAAALKHLNNLLMLIALIVYSAGMSKGVLWTKIRHPQLWGTSIWAFAHLLIGGDLASVLLFGTMLVWAQASVLLYNAQEGAWLRPAAGALKRDLVMVGGVLVAYGVIGWIHIVLGKNPFGGA